MNHTCLASQQAYFSTVQQLFNVFLTFDYLIRSLELDAHGVNGSSTAHSNFAFQCFNLTSLFFLLEL